MEFELKKSIEILERTPSVLAALLPGISDEWVTNNEGDGSFSPYDVVGHLIQGEKEDWIPRMEIILSGAGDKTFKPFDRFAQYRESKGKTLEELLAEFKVLRERNIDVLKSKAPGAADLSKEGIHPSFGTVTLRQLLATWVVHDLGHIAQVTRVMAKQYKREVGPWLEYLPVLTR